MRREDLLYRVPNPREALHPLTPFFELVECRLRPTAPVKQGVPVLHDLTPLAPMRQTSGHGQEPLAFARLHMPFDTQEAIVEHVTDLLLDRLAFAGSAARCLLFGRRSAALPLGFGPGQALTLLGYRLQHPLGQVFEHMEKPRQHLVYLSVHLSRPCWIGGKPLISMIGLSHDEDTFCLYAAPLLVKSRPIE